MSIFGKIFGSKTGKKLKKIEPLVKSINKLEENFSALSDSELAGLREDFIKRYQSEESLDDLLSEAFAVT